MSATVTKRFSREDLKKIKWVQNISGTDLHIPLNEDGKRGLVIKKDEVFELSSFFTEKQKLSCRALYDAFVGIPIGNDKPKIFLVGLSGPNDERIVKTTHKINNARFPKIEGGQQAPDKNYADVALMEVKLKELKELSETLPDEEREMRQAQIEAYEKKIAETKKQAKKDSALTVEVVGGGGEPDDEDEIEKVKDEDEDEDDETKKDEEKKDEDDESEDEDEDEESDEDEE